MNFWCLWHTKCLCARPSPPHTSGCCSLWLRNDEEEMPLVRNLRLCSSRLNEASLACSLYRTTKMFMYCIAGSLYSIWETQFYFAIFFGPSKTPCLPTPVLIKAYSQLQNFVEQYQPLNGWDASLRRHGHPIKYILRKMLRANHGNFAFLLLAQWRWIYFCSSQPPAYI